MTVNILTIKCPQCSSIKHSSLGDDKYKCESCGAIYFIDKNEQHIYIHQQNQSQETLEVNKITNFKILGLLGCLIPLVLVLYFYLTENSNDIDPVIESDSYQSTISSSEINKIKKEEWTHKNIKMFVDNETPFLIMESKLHVEDPDLFAQSKDQFFIKIFDINAKQFVSEFNVTDDNNKKISYEIKTWDQDEILLLINNQKFYQLNKKNKTFQDVEQRFFTNHTEFSQGLAKIEFVRPQWGSGLYVYTNKGKHFYYYPMIDKLYDEDAFYNARDGFKSLPANASTRISYQFDLESYDYPDENHQLIKYEYKYLPGFPREEPMFRWRKIYDNPSNQAVVVIYENTPFKKLLIHPTKKNDSRIIKYADFTPDRLYFFPQLLTFNDDAVLIAFTTSPVKTENYIVQLLNAKNTDIIFSYNFPFEFKQLNAEITKDHILLMTEDHFIGLNHEGKQDFLLDIQSLNSRE